MSIELYVYAKKTAEETGDGMFIFYLPNSVARSLSEELNFEFDKPTKLDLDTVNAAISYYFEDTKRIKKEIADYRNQIRDNTDTMNMTPSMEIFNRLREENNSIKEDIASYEDDLNVNDWYGGCFQFLKDIMDQNPTLYYYYIYA